MVETDRSNDFDCMSPKRIDSRVHTHDKFELQMQVGAIKKRKWCNTETLNGMCAEFGCNVYVWPGDKCYSVHTFGLGHHSGARWSLLVW